MAEKKQLDIKALIKVLLEEGLTLWAMKSIPVVGDLIELKERVELARKLETFLQQSVVQAERIAVLEQLAGLSQGQMEQMIQELMPQLDKNKAPPETQQFVTEWIAQIPQTAARKTTATRQLGSPVPLDSSEFYQDLIPARRPQDWRGQTLPHRSPPWKLQQRLGLGGFGEVWLAQNGLQQEAIKFCHDDARRAFLVKEFKTLQQMQAGLKNHPNIVQLKEFHLEGASPYWLAFEYMDGGDLFSLMQQRHLAWHDALILFRGIVSGVAAAHKLDFVHRDLKPANILLTADGVPKIADFGLSEALVVDLNGTADMGTAGYVSPEQLARKVAPSDDVYALGVIFWQLVTHTLHPPGGKAELESKLKASTIPKAAKKLVQQCLGKQANRPQNAGELLQPLEILLVKQKSTLLTSVIRWVLRKKVAEHPPSAPVPPAQEIPKAKEVAPDKAMPKPEQKVKLALDSSDSMPKTYTEPKTGIEFVWVEGGRYQMGSDRGYNDEKPVHWVNVDGFYMAKYPMTQGQWKALMDGANPSYFPKGDDYPVELVSWDDVMKTYLPKLNKLGNGSYRLPTEAEWEYAARSGGKDKLYAGSSRLGTVGWYERNSDGSTHPVGQKKPNGLGLYDMSGNVWEWCADLYDPGYYKNSPEDNPHCTGRGSVLVIRGGGWDRPAINCRAAFRGWAPDNRGRNVGFRLVLVAPRSK